MKYLIIQNIITPYRTSFFNRLAKEGFDFTVLYMRLSEEDRSWDIDLNRLEFPYEVFGGFYRVLFQHHIHWNPSLVKYVVKHKDAKVILGSGWNDMDIIAICILKRIGVVKNELIFWSEANYLTNGSRRDNPVKKALRSFVFKSGEGRIIVPGRMSVDTFLHWNIPVKQFILLPNVIDEKLFCSLDKSEKSVGDSIPHAVLPVRLVEKIKGIINFFEAIGTDNIKKAVFHVLGDGEDKEKIDSFIKSRGYEEHIILEGFKQNEELLSFYRDADFFILPSFSDQSPLSLVEAACCHLPLLVSNRCGNHYETVEDGKNGYLFDPEDRPSVKKAFEELLSNRENWGSMGNRSYQLYVQHFQQSGVIARFITGLQND